MNGIGVYGDSRAANGKAGILDPAQWTSVGRYLRDALGGPTLPYSNKGVNGQTTGGALTVVNGAADIAGTIGFWKGNGNPNLSDVVVLLGTNDANPTAWPNLQMPNVANNLATIAGIIEAASCVPWIVLPPPVCAPATNAEAWNTRSQEIMHECYRLGLSVLDGYSMHGPSGWDAQTTDGIHEAGATERQALANWIAGQMS